MDDNLIGARVSSASVYGATLRNATRVHASSGSHRGGVAHRAPRLRYANPLDALKAREAEYAARRNPAVSVTESETEHKKERHPGWDKLVSRFDDLPGADRTRREELKPFVAGFYGANNRGDTARGTREQLQEKIKEQHDAVLARFVWQHRRPERVNTIALDLGRF